MSPPTFSMPENAGLEQDAMNRLPLGKVVLSVAPARPFAIFLARCGCNDRCAAAMAVASGWSLA